MEKGSIAYYTKRVIDGEADNVIMEIFDKHQLTNNVIFELQQRNQILALNFSKKVIESYQLMLQK